MLLNYYLFMIYLIVIKNESEFYLTGFTVKSQLPCIIYPLTLDDIFGFKSVKTVFSTTVFGSISWFSVLLFLDLSLISDNNWLISSFSSISSCSLFNRENPIVKGTMDPGFLTILGPVALCT